MNNRDKDPSVLADAQQRCQPKAAHQVHIKKHEGQESDLSTQLIHELSECLTFAFPETTERPHNFGAHRVATMRKQSRLCPVYPFAASRITDECKKS